MRDVILRREGSKVTVSNPTTGHFEHLLNLTVGGAVNVTVTRGWTAVDAQVARDNGTGTAANSFRFVNTHLEAFDDETQVPSIRALQAGELFAPGGPADADRVILLGDLNSDDDTVAPAISRPTGRCWRAASASAPPTIRSAAA
jgi:endonuclease/exonuclease/phosphatase family metal-dependent hydrolase